ncbi:IPExxxVDY family protein [Christiangramia fulva]|uniref:IPExxxVDY family protein n=1 Tax=Christiangramia fulva TaxID=2126553 RepID=A0A2R3ZAN9_9FLAO|nr:IPExxxVDY family protein [Christiangramia fulva]AVR47336.1 IPExxxVDY family protein [Christiangramia fulva]
MQSHKMLLEVEEEPFSLIAIYASMEGFKMAYLLNKVLKIHLEREREDVDFNFDDYRAAFPLYTFKEARTQCSFHLVANKFKGEPKKIVSSGSLFDEEEISPKEVYLIPEYKKVDYFLKIGEEIEGKAFSRMLTKIGKIPQVQAAYAIEPELLKSKQNLIFE